MQLIVTSLILGFLIGYFKLLPNKITQLANPLMLVGLFILLFIMGVEIGINQKILSNLKQLGLEAILLASGSIIGSIIMLWLFNLVAKEE